MNEIEEMQVNPDPTVKDISMFQSIPASKIVSVNPAVLSSGGSPLSMNAVFLSKNENLPTGRHTAFPDASAASSRAYR